MNAKPHELPTFLAPYSAQQFMDEYWGKNMLLLSRNAPSFFSETITMEELDRIVTSIRIPATNFNLARNNSPLPKSAYCIGDEYVDKQKALRLHQDGATIILRSLEQWSPGLNRLRVAAEAAFGCTAQANVYLTPPSEKSTPPHWDTHDLAVLQVFGSKRWRIFRGERTFPLPDERFQVGVDAAHNEHEEIVLHAGDTLYLPRGIIHEPVAESYSVHISLGLHADRNYDLFVAALMLAARKDGSELRELYTGRPGVLELGEVMRNAELLKTAEEQLQAKFQAARAVDLEGRLLEVLGGPALDPETLYTWRQGVEVSVAPGSNAVSVGDQSISLPSHLVSLTRDSLALQSFSAGSLSNEIPLDERIALCAALWSVSALKIGGPLQSAR